MIMIGTQLLIMEAAISRLFFFFIFSFLYDEKPFPKYRNIIALTTSYILLLLIDIFLNNLGVLIYIVIMYFLLNRQKNPNFYLINCIILGLLFSIFESIVASGITIYVYSLFSTSEHLLTFIFLFSELIMTLLFIFLCKKSNIERLLKKSNSWTISIVLFYIFMVLTVFIYLIQKLEAYTALITGILVFLIIQSIVIFLIFIYEHNHQKEKFKRQLMEEQLNDLTSYTKQLDADQKEMHKFRHDYKNILGSLYEISNKHNNPELTAALKKLGVYSNTYFENISMDDFKDLEFVANPYIKSTLISKMRTIKSENIDCYFECKDTINQVDINIFDLIRIIGVSIDNALEETKRQKHGKIQIVLIKQDNQLDITIKNTISKKIPISKMVDYGFSTKKNHSGLGLVNVNDIKKKYRNLLIYYDVIDNWFCVQISIIHQGDKK
ncbi:GHKL domain-containing protein [Companilactobacillus futsaii]|uniref:GHKL domain-containing protein n=3 Tax=Companilactobacillus futsaii TaxID=938155 RepID=A0A5B7T142_9LACO|nr:GHKL domain-containing protein [Companilactobacillus futsaii]KRK96853.1 signal transduction protein [Companilactobacillus futsaii JCM 17355]QCX25666.1 GHKL domain-containing protein [Companilactobacillus futsaii]